MEEAMREEDEKEPPEIVELRERFCA